jgi:hypothetical protein
MGLLALAELLLRLPQVREWLPTRTHYYDSGVVVRLDAVERVMRTHGRVDVLFVGSSIVRTNIQPLTFDRLIGTDAGSPVTSFNVGLSGLWPTAVHLYVQHVWLSAAQPRVVVQGVRYPELAATTHALGKKQVFSGTIEAAWTDANWITRLRSAATSRILLLQYRGALAATLQRYVNGRPGPWIEGDGGHQIDRRGYTPRMGAASAATHRFAGTLKSQPRPSCLNGDCSVGFAALARTIEAVRGAGAEYVLLNVPEHGSQWRDADGPDRYRDYLRALEAFARQHGILLLDPTEGDPFRFDGEEEFTDPYHMTPAGAERLTAALARGLRTHAGKLRQDIGVRSASMRGKVNRLQ